MSKATVLLPLLSLSMTVELGSAHKQWSAFWGMFRRITYATPSRGDPGQPLFLTPYIESRRTEEGRQLSLVGPLPGANVMSYSGYFTVNKIHNSNLFWFFPTQCLNESFLDMLYIDNPVGTGFSFTDNTEYAVNQDDVGRDLYSVKGKYVPTIGYYIHTHNLTAKVKINFKGVAIGDGFCDPEMMLGGYAQFLYQIGLVDEKQRDYVQQQTDLGVIYIQQKKWTEAFEIFDFLINDDETRVPSYSRNVTGCSNFFNVLQCQKWMGPDDEEYFGEFLLLPEVRKSIHVGNLTFHDGSTVEKHLLEDVMNTIKPWLAILMDNYKVLLYSGQLDVVVVAAPLTERFLPTVPWSKVEDYKNKNAERLVWKIHPQDKEVAGYVCQAGDFYQVIVRSGGHILPYDQPERKKSLDMIDRFISGKGWKKNEH